MAKYVTINTKVKKIVRRGAPGPAIATADPTFDSVTMNTAASPPASPVQGQYWWDADEETISFKQDGTTLQIGQETQANVRNIEGSTLLDGTPAMAVGSIGASGRITVEKMDGTIPALAKALFGIATEDIDDDGDGKITNFGKIRGINTTGTPVSETWLDGDILWVGTDTAGTLTNIEPPRTAMGMPVAFVINAHATTGSIFVRITPLDEHLLVTPDQRDALDVANSPSASNAIATIADVGSGGGAIDWENPIAINTATALTISRHHVISDLGTPADYIVTLPAVSGNAGKLISWEIAADVTKIITVDGNAAETIDSELTRIMWATETAILSCDGTTWTKIAGKSIPMTATLSRQTGTVQAVATAVVTKVTMDTFSSNTEFLTMSNSQVIIPRPSLWSMNGFWAMSRASTIADGSASLVTFGVNATAFPDDPAGVGATIPFSTAGGDLFGYVAAGYTYQGDKSDTLELIAYTDQNPEGVNIRLGGVVAATLSIVEVITW